ncbi:hypothetical protein PHYBOEH_002761 [Phytophthora boehmeriae]|uniref:C2H2-type domain-containing protein n=1 Tax=Phytophthora boehmeriae TaxID=109152 RepID=A0A8T1WRP6_9STRA|nr:hypothetical protein PHYBOEH_002761 [Phytophthora boehmeriae]
MMSTTISIQPPFYMAPMLYDFPVQPVPCQSVVPIPAIQQQPYSPNSQCAKPNTVLPRKRFHVCPAPSCGKRFTTSGNLSRHKRMHGKIDPLKCPMMGCICVFPSTNKLERHLKFHYGGNVKVCRVETCGRTFSTTGNLNRHLKKHHDGMTSPNAASPTTYPTSGSDSKASTQSWSPCSTSSEFGSDHDTDTSPVLCWSTATDPGANTVLFDSVWNEELLDALEAMLDEPVDVEERG